MAKPAKQLEWTELDSSNVHAVAYHEPSKTLAVRFKSGGLYTYMDAGEEYYTGITTAISAGQYLNTVIKLMCPYIRWNDEAELLEHLSL